jgi:hypothetical protein
VIEALQAMLERLYDVACDHDVRDYLVTDRRVLHGSLPCNDARAPEEELLLAELPDGAGVALYLDAALLGRLAAADPRDALTEANLEDFCTALEGVSHFVYSTWRLHRDSPVSLLELETQAEVDKYAVTVFLTSQQQGRGFPRDVHARLFDRVRFDSRLDTAQYHRYRTAHRSAAHYCRRLESWFVSRGQVRIEPLLRELRRFYRLGSAAKVRHAASA